jgi:outer membrane protein OmpA-like peptidoglycan-associated protein
MKALHWLGMLCAVSLLAGCQTAPKKNLDLERVSAQLEQLKADPKLAGLAPLALGEAERALRYAEQAGNDKVLQGHLIYMAERRIQIARVVAQREELLQAQALLTQSRNDMLVKASQLETERAREEADHARRQFAASAEDAERLRQQKDAAQLQEAETARVASQAQAEAAQARRLAESSASEAELARREANLAVAQMDTMKRQLENLQLRETESGVVVTLGDVLFQTGQADLLDSSMTSLVEVVDLLQTEPDKSIRIEGHTDATGPAEVNLRLSQQRADSVMNSLASLGVSAGRMKAVGMGEDYPIASNDDEDGRSRNRRVDVILLDDQ